jgi:O-methyltransferase
MNKQNRELQAIFGHFLDLYRIAKFTFNHPHSYTKFRAIYSMKKRTNAKCLIETGTYLGVTTRRCVPHFDKIYTIELDKDLATQAKKFLDIHSNIEVVQGDAINVLPGILEKSSEGIVVFLDAHFSGGVTTFGDSPEPAFEELEILSKFKDRINGIIIDDFRCFGVDDGFPSKSSLFNVLERLFPSPSFTTKIYLDQVIIECKSKVS